MSYCISREWQRHAAGAFDIPSGCRPYLAGVDRAKHPGSSMMDAARVCSPMYLPRHRLRHGGIVDCSYPRLLPPLSGSDHINRRKGKDLVTVKRRAGLTATRGFGLLTFSRCVQYA